MPKAAAAGFVGALLEWYDFYIFATGAALVFGQVFFPGHDPVARTMAAFGAFAAGFLARPLGGFIFGHIGDRLGRKTSLIATLVIIGIGTFLIGLLPGYAAIGPAAPILLVILRVLQGIGLGGEYGGASLIAIEHAPRSRRGFWGSLPQAASPGGLLLATGVFSLSALLPHDAFMAWGWRIPFLLSAVMLAVGLYVRLSISETPDFIATAEQTTALPAMQLLRTHKRSAILATGARLAETVAGNMIKSFGLTYVTVALGLGAATALGAQMATAAVGLVVTPLFGLLGDRFGRRQTYMAGAAFAALLAFPFFWLLGMRTDLAVWVGFIIVYNLGPTLMLSVQPSFFAELFAPRVRYTGLSVAYQVSSIVGGFTPLAALWLLQVNGNRPWLVAAMIAAVGVLSFICAAVSQGRLPAAESASRAAARSVPVA
ncbi:MAG TPA: MFS transporter [Acetobacteraceae bacterium]|nr:MFS transporter [Acetobacteraceae bacterium]